MLKVGVLGHVMPLLFSFDATFEEGDTQLPLVTAARTGPSLTELASERPTMQVIPTNLFDTGRPQTSLMHRVWQPRHRPAGRMPSPGNQESPAGATQAYSKVL